MFTVKVSQKNGPEQVLNFSEREVRIGRVSSNEIVLPKSNISKRHALLTHSSGGLAITDTKSTNGTFVNGERINGVCDLSLGDKIYLGEFTVEIMDIEQSETLPHNPSRAETKSQPKLSPIAPGDDAILSDDWGANGEISDSWTGDWKSQTSQAQPGSAAVDALDMASGFPTIEPSLEAQDFAPEVIIPPAPATSTIPVASNPTPYVDGASTASVVENPHVADLDLDEPDEPDQSDEPEVAPETASESHSAIAALLEDPSTLRVDIYGPGPIFLDSGSGATQTETEVSAETIEQLVSSYLSEAGLSREAAGSVVDVALSSGIRVQMSLPPLVATPALTIHRASSHPENLDALVPDLLCEAAANLLQESLCIGHSMVVVSNGYQSNPDHVLGALAASIPESKRLVALGAAGSLELPQPQATCLNVPDGRTSRSALIQHALSLKPGYIVLGDNSSNFESIAQLQSCGHQSFLASVYGERDQANASHANILIFQENGSDGPVITAIHQRNENEYKELFTRSEDGTLEPTA